MSTKRSDTETVSLSVLRANIFRIFDRVIQTGTPVTVIRRGKRIKIMPEFLGGRLSKIKRRKGLRCKPGELLDVSWEDSWKADDLS